MVHVVLAGGGSAGHTSPLIATAQRLLARDGVSVSCLGTADKLEARVIPAAGLEIDFIPRVPMPRRPNLDLLRLPGRLGGAVARTRQILADRHADVVIGFGGYVSPPAYVAAKLAKLPFLVHEGNALPGMANKLGARLTPYVATTYLTTKLPKARTIGMPMRESITSLDRAAARAQARAALGLEGDRPTLLVSGGSLGARSLNEATTAAVDDLLARGWDVVHVWGLTNFRDDLTVRTDPTTGASYHPLPFVDAMEQAYAAADLMLCRAGSNTVNEVGAIGLPAIFVPLPHGNGEQRLNAVTLVEAGGGVLVDDAALDAARLLAEIDACTPQRRAAMSAAGASLIPSDAAERLAAWALEVAR